MPCIKFLLRQGITLSAGQNKKVSKITYKKDDMRIFLSFCILRNSIILLFFHTYMCAANSLRIFL